MLYFEKLRKSFFWVELEPNTTLLTNAIELELPAFPNAPNIGRITTCIKRKKIDAVT
jgi:hypothetical protein